MLLAYGISCPYATFAIGVSAEVQIQLLRANICRYYNLQTSNKDGDVDLEAICRQSQNTVHAMLWPGVTLSTILFSLFVFDMAYDTDELSIEAPLSVLILTLLTIPVSRYVFYYFKNKLDSARKEHTRFSMEIPHVVNPLALPSDGQADTA